MCVRACGWVGVGDGEREGEVERARERKRERERDCFVLSVWSCGHVFDVFEFALFAHRLLLADEAVGRWRCVRAG